MGTTQLQANYTYWGNTMKEIKCSQCDKMLSQPVENGHHIEGYYLYNQEAYCADCWDRRETGMVVLAKRDDGPGQQADTTWVVMTNGSSDTKRKNDS